MNKIIRKKNENYTVVSNVCIRDNRLSLKAKGLMSLVMSLPNDWDFSIQGLSSIVKEGKSAIYTAINELKDFGYCQVVSNRDDKGKIIGNDYTFFEEPCVDTPCTEKPYIENQDMDNPNMDNQPQINKDIKEIKTENKKDKDKSLSKKTTKDELFEECWLAYRRKGKKGKAYPYWKKLTDDEKQSVLPHIKAYVQANELQYQQDFERYLRDKTFQSIVISRNNVVYDPTKFDSTKYTPQGRTIWFNEETKSYWSDDNFYYGVISDGYTDDNRPDGATITLNNARGDIRWDSETKKWDKVQK